jgi:hypothetical protein
MIGCGGRGLAKAWKMGQGTRLPTRVYAACACPSASRPATPDGLEWEISSHLIFRRNIG